MLLIADLSVPKHAWQASILYVPLPTKTLKTLGYSGHGTLGCVELGHRGHQAEEEGVLVIDQTTVVETKLSGKVKE